MFSKDEFVVPSIILNGILLRQISKGIYSLFSSFEAPKKFDELLVEEIK